jgi:NTP pyrophosphatase (non-canonical NTP hydrolase)
MSKNRRETVTATITVHPSILRMAQTMQHKLNKNHHKAHWSKATFQELRRGLNAECAELREAIITNAPDPEKWEEASDVANFAMFLAETACDDNLK